MADDATFESDKGIGVAIVLGLLAMAAAGVQLAAHGTVTGAFGFAGAMTLGSLLVVALHVYE